MTPEIQKTLKDISQNCKICAKSNPISNMRLPPFPTHQATRAFLRTDWQADFTNMPLMRCIRYFLVFIDTLQDGSTLSPLQTKEPPQ
jgi:hypothetical protein